MLLPPLCVSFSSSSRLTQCTLRHGSKQYVALGQLAGHELQHPRQSAAEGSLKLNTRLQHRHGLKQYAAHLLEITQERLQEHEEEMLSRVVLRHT